jgi:hypothetical protein
MPPDDRPPDGAAPARAVVPPGWPRGVLPQGAPGWERSATAWLLDQCPPDYRGYPVLLRHPVALAQLAVHVLVASLGGCRSAQAQARAQLRDVVPPPVVEQVLEALSAEEARLLAAGRAAGLLLRALRGERYVPRL